MAACGTPAHASELSNAWGHQRMQEAMSVQGGSAPIEQALSTIIPAPYKIELDKSVPSSMVVVWPAGDDWMGVLRHALAPMSIYVEPDWKHNVIRVVSWSPEHYAKQAVAAHAGDIMPGTRGASRAVAAPSYTDAQGAPGPTDAQIKSAFASVTPHAEKKAVPAVSGVAKHPSPARRPTPKSKSLSRSTYVIPAGRLLSQGLADYLDHFGWHLHWTAPDDYMLDAPLPIPAGTVKHGVRYVVRTYKSQGGLLGDMPSFRTANKVVVIAPATVEEN